MITREYCRYIRTYSELDGLQHAHTFVYCASATPQGALLELRSEQGGRVERRTALARCSFARAMQLLRYLCENSVGLEQWLEVLADVLAPVLGWLGIPPETVGLMLVRPISGSAALGVGSELISTYGPDSTIGRTAAVMLGSTETTFYTIAVYFGATGIRKSRYAVPAALCADAAGFFFAALTVRLFMK